MALVAVGQLAGAPSARAMSPRTKEKLTSICVVAAEMHEVLSDVIRHDTRLSTR